MVGALPLRHLQMVHGLTEQSHSLQAKQEADPGAENEELGHFWHDEIELAPTADEKVPALHAVHESDFSSDQVPALQKLQTFTSIVDGQEPALH